MPGQQMIVAAAKRRHDIGPMTRSVPQSSLISDSAGRTSAADENQVAAALAAKQLCGPADLADRNPVMAKARDACRIAGAFEREQDRHRGRARLSESATANGMAPPPAITPTGEEISEAADVMAAADSRRSMPCRRRRPEGTARDACRRR